MTTLQPSRNPSWTLYIVAVLAGLAAGGLLLFGRRLPVSDAEGCETSVAQAAGLQELATGEVAAFIVAKSPRRLPDFSYIGTAGKTQIFAAGKITLLNFWATWCIPCREEMPALDALQKKRGGADFSVLPVSLDAGGLEKPQKFYADVKIRNLPLSHDADGQIFQTFRKAGLISALPTSLLIDRQGCLLGTLAGPANWSGESALKLIDRALKK